MPRLRKTILLLVSIGILVVFGGCASKTTAPKAPETSQPTAAQAPEWPTRDITFIVPFKPGGGHDILARTTAPFLEKYLPKRVNVVVENVPAASAKVAMVQLFKTKPDGYTIGVFNIADLAMMYTAKQLGDVDARNLPYLGRLDRHPIMLAVGAKSGFKKPQDMKGKPVRFAAVGPAVTFNESVLARALGCTPQFVNYDGSGEGATAVMRGDVDAIALSAPSVLRNVRASEGKLVPMFITAPAPESPDLKEIPVARDLGVQLDEELLVESRVIVAPPGLPADLQRMWEETIAKVYNDPEWTAQMRKAGYTPAPLQREELKSVVAKVFEEIEKYKDIVATISAGW